jgi:hypothetical protein
MRGSGWVSLAAVRTMPLVSTSSTSRVLCVRSFDEDDWLVANGLAAKWACSDFIEVHTGCLSAFSQQGWSFRAGAPFHELVCATAVHPAAGS